MINRRLVLLMSAALGLGAYGVWSGDGKIFVERLSGAVGAPQLVVQAQAPVAQETAPATAPAKSLNPLSELEIAALSEITERPLFNPTRAPAEAQQEVATETAAVPETPVIDNSINPDDFTLLAVADNSENKIALVRRNSTNEIFHLKEGQTFSDWQVLAVGDRQITLGLNGNTVDLKMFGRRTDVPPAPVSQNEGDDSQDNGAAIDPNNGKPPGVANPPAGQARAARASAATQQLTNEPQQPIEDAGASDGASDSGDTSASDDDNSQ